MDLSDVEPLSARSTSSLEDGTSSARSKKSKTLARLRKLKKVDPSPRDITKEELVPHPPKSPQRDDSSDRKLSNGIVNTGSEHNDDHQISSKMGADKMSDVITGDDRGKLNGLGLDPLPSTLGETPRLKSSPFGSPLDPLKPSKRGLGLEPLVPLGALQPLGLSKINSQAKPEKNIERTGFTTSGIIRDNVEVSEPVKETFNSLSHSKDGLRIDGAVETETSDSQQFDPPPLPKSFQEDSSHVEKERIPHQKIPSEDVLSNSSEKSEDDDLIMLPDNGESNENKSNVLVSSAMKERIKPSDTTDDVANTQVIQTENENMTNRQSLISDSSDISNRLREPFDSSVAHEEMTKPRTTVTIVDEDEEESDDELIVVSPLPSQHKSQKPNFSLKNENHVRDVIIDDERDDLPNRTIPGDRDDAKVVDGDVIDDDDGGEDDEENLKQYLEKKLEDIEDDEDNDALAKEGPSDALRAGRLSPILNASAPPPLPNTIMSPSLRTMYKRDDDLEDSFATSEISDAVGSGGSYSETNRSVASSSLLLNTLTNKNARKGNRSYLSGGVRNTGSLVGKDELDAHLPERRLRIFVATWNMHEDKEIPENLDDLLLPDDIEYMQDVYVIGTQESTPDIPEWEIRLQETLGPSHVLLHSAAHGVLQCLVFIRRDLIWFCSPVEESRVSTRPGSMIKTKGAIAVSFNFFGTSFIFIVSHFTSGDENMKERLLDYEKILKGISLPEKVPPTRKFNILTSDVTTRFDCVFWCGDFNFRLAENKARVEGWIEQLKRGNKDDYDILLQHDQLNKAMQRKEIFQGFQEGQISFLPTYKFDIGEDVYDTSAKARVPSYTDRVLYKSRRAADISLIHYSSCEEIRTSDHRPVYGVFEAGIRPGKENSIMGGGMFVRQVYLEGIKRRVAKSGMSKRTQSASAVCSVM